MQGQVTIQKYAEVKMLIFVRFFSLHEKYARLKG